VPEWAIALLSTAVGFAGAAVPAWLQIRHERRIRFEDAATNLLGRFASVKDAVGYALSSVESQQPDANAVPNAMHLTGELSNEVGRCAVLLGQGAGGAALDAYDELRRTVSLLDQDPPDLANARNAFQGAQEQIHVIYKAVSG
jgi:hypothetical protein